MNKDERIRDLKNEGCGLKLLVWCLEPPPKKLGFEFEPNPDLTGRKLDS